MVSIPRRYAENYQLFPDYMHNKPVSIPRRYAENLDIKLMAKDLDVRFNSS